MTNTLSVWVFHGAGSQFTSGVFSSMGTATEWIEKHGLTGALTKYPVDVGVYDWANKNGLFTVKKDHETSTKFIQRFTTASQEHYHFEDGKREG